MWLDEDGYSTAASVYRERLAALNKTARPIFFRLAEKTERPEAIQRLRKSINMTHEFVTMARNMSANLTEVCGTRLCPCFRFHMCRNIFTYTPIYPFIVHSYIYTCMHRYIHTYITNMHVPWHANLFIRRRKEMSIIYSLVASMLNELTL